MAKPIRTNVKIHSSAPKAIIHRASGKQETPEITVDDKVESGDMNAVTSNAVNSALNSALGNYHKMADITVSFSSTTSVEVSLRNYVSSSSKLLGAYILYTDSYYYETFQFCVIDDTDSGGSVRLRCTKSSTSARTYKIKIVYKS